MFTRIKALNYRCLRYVSQELGSLNVLVGPNGSGKSSFLDILCFLGDCVRKNLREAVLLSDESGRPGRSRDIDELIFKQQSDRFELVIELRIPESLVRSEEKEGARLEIARYEIGIGKGDSGEPHLWSEALWLRPIGDAYERDSQQLELFPFEAQAPTTINVGASRGAAPRTWHKVVSKSPGAKGYFSAEGTKYEQRYMIRPQEVYLANLPADERQFAVALWIRERLTSGLVRISFDVAAMKRPCKPTPTTLLHPDGSNLPVVVEHLKGHSPASYQEWVDHLVTALPELSQVEVISRPEDNYRYLRVRFRSGAVVPSWLLSEGTLRLLALTLIAYLPDNSATYLIEEPENGIHPQALEVVFQSLSSLYDGQVLMATHSPLIVGLAKQNQILCFGKNESGSVAVVNGADHPRLRDWQGEVELSTLYAAGVLG